MCVDRLWFPVHRHIKKKAKPVCTRLSYYSRSINVSAVAPAVHTVLLFNVSKVDVPAGNIPLIGEISDHIQSVSAAPAHFLFPVHHLTAITTKLASTVYHC